MRRRNYKLRNCVFLLILSGLISCSKSDPVSKDCSEEGFVFYPAIENESQRMVDAVMIYSQDPTEKNCKNFKSALEDYRKALNGLEACARKHGYTAEWNQALQDFEQEIKDIKCD